MATQIPAPINLQADLTNTGDTYITVTWDLVSYPQLPAQGYTVEMLIDSLWIEVKNARYD